MHLQANIRLACELHTVFHETCRCTLVGVQDVVSQRTDLCRLQRNAYLAVLVQPIKHGAILVHVVLLELPVILGLHASVAPTLQAHILVCSKDVLCVQL